MANKRSFCFNIAFHNFATLKNWLTYQCPSSWPVVITMKKKLAGTWKKNIGYWAVQMNGNKFATGQILEKPVEIVKGRIFAG
jgi:predicted phage-related endonuclease